MKNIMLMACCRSGHNFVIEQLKSWDVDKQLLIYNCEDMLPANYGIGKYAIVASGLLLDTELQTYRIIVVRDLLNWWASYLKWAQETPFMLTPKKIRYAFTIWSAQVLEANLPLDDAVQVLQREGRTMGVVVDEQSRAVGIVAMADLLQEIFSKLSAA